MAKTKTKTKAKGERIEKAELFAYAYIKHMGNGTAAAKEVYQLDNDGSANTRAYEMLRKSEVQKIIGKYLDAQRSAYKKMLDRSDFFMSTIAQVLMEMLMDKELNVHDRMKAMDKLSRLAGTDLSEDIKLKQIEAKASVQSADRGRAIIPGLPAPGAMQVNNDNRRTLFLLKPPPIPPGGVPTPALMEQWKETYEALGFKEGIDLPSESEDNTEDAVPHPQ